MGSRVRVISVLQLGEKVFPIFMMFKSNREVLEIQATMPEELAPHGDTCMQCRQRRLASRCASTILKRTDIPDEQLLNEWAEEITRQMKQLPSTN